MKKNDKTDGILIEYFIDKKYYCSKCKYYSGECIKKRVVKECREKRLRNV